MPHEIFHLYPSAKWEVNGTSISFPLAECKESYANRIVPHKRPYREGARLDDTHSDPIIWTLTIEAYNSPDHEEDVEGLDFYPTGLNTLLDSFTTHETGDLVLPTRGPRRCRATSYERVERHGERDAAAVVMVFTEDNEDDAEAADFQAPNAASVVKKTAEDAVRADVEEGAGGDLGSQLNEFSAGIEGTLEAPGEFVGDIESMASAISNNVDSIENTFAKTTAEAKNEVETLLTNPSASRAGRLNRKVADIASKAVTQVKGAAAGGLNISTKTFDKDLNLYVIASSVDNDAVDVLNLNPSLDPFFVPAGTLVRFFG